MIYSYFISYRNVVLYIIFSVLKQQYKKYNNKFLLYFKIAFSLRRTERALKYLFKSNKFYVFLKNKRGLQY